MQKKTWKETSPEDSMGSLNLTMLIDQKYTSVCPLGFVQHLRLLWSHRRICPRWLRLDHHYHRLLWSHTGEPVQVGSGWITTDPSDNIGELVQPSWPRLNHHRTLWSHTRELAQVGSGWTTTDPSGHTALSRFSPCFMLGTFIFQNRFIIAVHCSLCNPFMSSLKKKYKENNSSHIFWSL